MTTGPKRALAAGAVLLAALALAVEPLEAQTAISADGVVESTSGGFMFPDGTVQTSAAASGSAPVADTGLQQCWDTAGTVASCPGTGQDGELQAGVDWPAPRFTDNGDGTVTDNLTGLLWLKDADCFGARTWAQALSDANTLASGTCSLTDGSSAGDWRLPNIREFLSLLDYSQVNPMLPIGHPFTPIQAFDFYWTSSTFIAGTDFAWVVFLSNGVVNVLDKPAASNNVYVWPVRDGQ
jgi:Protein of unknown function (DUF1566)